MPRARLAIPALISVLVFVALIAAAASLPGRGGSSRPARVVTTTVDPRPEPSAQLARAEAVVTYAHAVTVQQVGEYLHALAVEAVGAFLASIPPPPPPAPPVAVEPSLPAAPAAGVIRSGGCASGGGGNYAVPTAIVMRESGGNYCAANPSGACGAYQIMPGTWNGYGGYASACDAPPAVQDEKARSMAACNWQPPNYCAG